MSATIQSLLESANPDRILFPGDGGMTYGDLLRSIQRARQALDASGIGREDTVATVLRNGPETAAAFLALVSCCRVAPINPAYRAAEMTSAFADLKPAAVITTADHDKARHVAEVSGIPTMILERSDGATTKGFELIGPKRYTGRTVSRASEPDDIALLLHTSGTTARSKLVPLTHRSLYLSATRVAQTLKLTPEDRCLSVMPLFHIHGLVAGLLSSVAAGASVYCAPGFQATSFFSWLESSRATWFTAVPTMHQAILARAPRNRAILAGHRLRLIRSCSSPLYGTVREGLTTAFGVPVINAYGMTEAAHQIASESFGGPEGHGGTVGPATGLEIAVMDAGGAFLRTGETGEVVLRGEQMMNGYLCPPGANDTAFWQEWFRTGDQGFLDAAGALTLVGRTKEMINSGGEKISPYEVERALLQHPGVAQAVAFAMPHRMLGEAVAAAIVVREGWDVKEGDLLQTSGEYLSRHKLPRRFVFVGEIPRGATGKPQRIGLAAQLGLG